MNDFSKILLQIRTEEERNKLSLEIDSLLQSLFRESSDFKNVIDSQISKDLREFMLEIINNQVLSQALREKLSETLSALNKEIEMLEVITLTIAFEPTSDTIKKLSDAIRRGFGEKTILKIKIDARVLGGALLEFKGIYQDVSLKTKLEEVFKTKRKELFSILNNKQISKTQISK